MQLSEDMKGNKRTLGYRATEETRRLQSEAAKRSWKIGAEARKAQMKTPEYRQAVSKGLANSPSKQKRSEKMSERHRKLWEDPEYRKKQTDRMIGKKYALGHKQSDEARRKKSEAAKRIWATRKRKDQ